MRTAIRKHLRDFLAIVAVAAVAVLVGGFILAHQRFYLPHWVPVVGSDFVDYKVVMPTAQAVTPGQGQTVNIAGVPVGEIGSVELKDGRAVITMKIRRKYTPIYRNANVLLRPKTGLNDMVIELDPGNKVAGPLPHNTIPVANAQANVNPDEFFAGLDVETRDYLRLLLAGAGQGLQGNSKQLAATLKRFDPTARYLKRIGQQLAVRNAAIRHSIHNFRELSQALGDRDTQLGVFVDASNRVFQSFANQEASLRASLRLLPGALQKTNAALAQSQTLSEQLGPTLGSLMPFAEGLAPALQSFQTLTKETTPVIRDQLRPFTKTAAPAVAALKPAAHDLAAAAPDLDTTLGVFNTLFNELAYNPPGKQEGFLYWLGWANHATASMFGSQDAHGPIRRGIVYGNCTTLQIFERIGAANPVLGTLAALLNAPTYASVCGPAAKAASASAAATKTSTGGGGGGSGGDSPAGAGAVASTGLAATPPGATATGTTATTGTGG